MAPTKCKAPQSASATTKKGRQNYRIRKNCLDCGSLPCGEIGAKHWGGTELFWCSALKSFGFEVSIATPSARHCKASAAHAAGGGFAAFARNDPCVGSSRAEANPQLCLILLLCGMDKQSTTWRSMRWAMLRMKIHSIETQGSHAQVRHHSPAESSHFIRVTIAVLRGRADPCRGQRYCCKIFVKGVRPLEFSIDSLCTNIYQHYGFRVCPS